MNVDIMSTNSINLQLIRYQSVRFDSDNISLEAKILLLLEIGYHPEKIAETLGKDKKTIWRPIKRFLACGWVVKPASSYRMRFTLTNTGRSKMIEAFAKYFVDSGLEKWIKSFQVIKRCGDCFHFKNKTEISRGSWKSGSKTVLKCGVKNNPHLPESLRYGNNMSVAHLANDCPLWNYPVYPSCRGCVEKHYGTTLDTPIETALKNTSGLLFSNPSNMR